MKARRLAMNAGFWWAAPIVIAGVVAACEVLPSAPDDSETLEGPIETLTSEQRARHFAGDAEFSRRFATADGLGPLFIATACEACHAADGKGHPLFNITRFGRAGAGGFDPMVAEGGPQLQNRAILNYVAEQLPAGASGVALFTPPSVTGLGYLEAVDDTTLLALADPNDSDGDGISGRVQLLDGTPLVEEVVALGTDPLARDARGVPIGGRYIGRFGKKAGTVNLLQQVVTAYHEDMGLTTDLFPVDIVNVQVGGLASDDVADPEVPSSVVQSVAFYLQTLRAPPRRGASDPAVMAGEALFAQVGCASCHMPSLQTGRSTIAALDRVVFRPYTDLLLHDMGSELDDGFTDGSAATSEWRTAPLWGLGLAKAAQGGSVFLLHDGRARTIADAIRFHGGEAAASRASFDALTPAERQQLIRFLESL